MPSLTVTCSTPPSPPPPTDPPPPEPPAPPAPPPSAPQVILTTSFVASGDVSDYDETTQDAIKAVVATEAGVDPSQVTLSISAASVLITATITVLETDGASVTTTLGDGIFQNAEALTTALTDAGVSGVTVATIESAPAQPCTRACAGTTCEQSKLMPCDWLSRIGCNCAGCCAEQAPDGSTPPNLCGPGLTWNGRKCEIECAA